VVGILRGGDHDNRDQVRFSSPLQPVAKLETIDIWEHEVEQDQIGTSLGNRRKSLLARRYLNRFKPASLHKIGQDIISVALIVDDQNGARHGEKLEETEEVCSLPVP
jgi:hypothetical protein